ncbi:hypothetical protein HYH02_004798 [Chlamydomonas schloesseri]|uniref:Uncharacterized protein n=1 Tax=Chlamydomonas schloesseri TaxID=2026947 RepID=A0A836B844_9CHLO|nr:hypothetical protein HYH02_004798 [Chlamydomonas schloesseri]|eukprot:KAG2450290.1 hypothetical protein HYH02_004798 [Chlamydomonas schloesseri]
MRCAAGASPAPGESTPPSSDGASSSSSSSSSSGSSSSSSSRSSEAAAQDPSSAIQHDPLSLEAAVATLETIWDLARRRHQLQQDQDDDEDQHDHHDQLLLRYFPDSVVDGADELRSAAESDRPLTFRDVVEYGFEIKGFTFDSYAERHLFFSPPGAVTRLSGFRTAPDRCVLRYAVAERAQEELEQEQEQGQEEQEVAGAAAGAAAAGGGGGERAVLTFVLECREMLSPHYRSARIDYVWQVVSVTGEADPAALQHHRLHVRGLAGGTAAAAAAAAGGQEEDDGGEHPRGPHPCVPPEAVVAAQLAALKANDPATVFAFASPGNQAATGPLERFATMLQNPMYRPLLRHRTAAPYRRKMLGPTSYSEVAKVVSDNTGMDNTVEMVYLWELSKQGPAAGPFEGCWMVDGVSLVAAKVLS